MTSILLAAEFPLSGKYADPVTVPPLKSVGIGRTVREHDTTSSILMPIRTWQAHQFK